MVWKVVEKATLLRLGKVRVVDSYPTKLSTFGLNKNPEESILNRQDNASKVK